MLPDVCNGSANDLTLPDQGETEPLYGNTDAESSHAPISVENLWNFVKEKKNSKVDNFRQEYEVGAVCFSQSFLFEKGC